jgi:hypothetical protein
VIYVLLFSIVDGVVKVNNVFQVLLIQQPVLMIVLMDGSLKVMAAKSLVFLEK